MTGLYLRRLGSGAGRPALALHCMMGTGATWQPIAERLGGRVDLAALDLPSHGRSPAWRPGEGGFFDKALTGAAGVLDDLAQGTADGRVDLIGHSLGAVAALRLAVGAPQRVRSLSLVEPVLFAALPAAARDPDGLLVRLASLTAKGAREEATAAFLHYWDGPVLAALPAPARAAMVDQMAAVMDSMPDLYEDRSGILTAGGLERIGVPAVLIAGARSPALIGAIAEVLAGRLPDAARAVVPKAGHMAPLTQPAAVAGLIAANLDRA
ncbi:hypothetical protein B0A89_13935 [Paracoccus contaminans]|uniref:AB hydrolase-1 domain-containing protein n=2 Tax=Paracoccus contaminans TaxID=1945662 RepID=A0A1W6D0G4_9RHOB|nr:hypothetical protein B0A89_13935 [Paracoccus contaminans]